MPRLVVVLSAAAVIMLAAALPSNAQTSRGAFSIPAASKIFTPVEKAACGPFRGRWCGPFHHRVCGPRHCWCAPC